MLLKSFCFRTFTPALTALLLGSFASLPLYAQGVLSDEELERIRAELAAARAWEDRNNAQTDKEVEELKKQGHFKEWTDEGVKKVNSESCSCPNQKTKQGLKAEKVTIEAAVAHLQKVKAEGHTLLRGYINNSVPIDLLVPLFKEKGYDPDRVLPTSFRIIETMWNDKHLQQITKGHENGHHKKAKDIEYLLSKSYSKATTERDPTLQWWHCADRGFEVIISIDKSIDITPAYTPNSILIDTILKNDTIEVVSLARTDKHVNKTFQESSERFSKEFNEKLKETRPDLVRPPVADEPKRPYCSKEDFASIWKTIQPEHKSQNINK